MIISSYHYEYAECESGYNKLIIYEIIKILSWRLVRNGNAANFVLSYFSHYCKFMFIIQNYVAFPRAVTLRQSTTSGS